MNPSDYVRKEAEEITQRTGRFIPQYRMTNLMETAHKVMELLSRADICMTYEESEMVLNICSEALRAATGK